jgi:hypothetical protein
MLFFSVMWPCRAVREGDIMVAVDELSRFGGTTQLDSIILHSGSLRVYVWII